MSICLCCTANPEYLYLSNLIIVVDVQKYIQHTLDCLLTVSMEYNRLKSIKLITINWLCLCTDQANCLIRKWRTSTNRYKFCRSEEPSHSLPRSVSSATSWYEDETTILVTTLPSSFRSTCCSTLVLLVTVNLFYCKTLVIFDKYRIFKGMINDYFIKKS